MDGLTVFNLTCEYRTNPLGLDVRKPRISWKLRSDRNGTFQTAYRWQVAAATAGSDAAPWDAVLWDSGAAVSDQSIHVEYGGPDLEPRTRYCYRVKVWDGFGRESDWSEPAWWETGLMEHSNWSAEWITPSSGMPEADTKAAFMLRRSFSLKGGIVSARIYASALGLYELYLNGVRVGEELLTPGWTSYHHRIQYQTYDVTSLLQEGGNGIGLMLADGWYKGGMGDQLYRYGERRAAIAELWVRYEDGSEDVVATDSSWKAETGPVRYANIYHGERYDGRLERAGWSEARFDDFGWVPVEVPAGPTERLVAQENEPVRVTEVLRPVAVLVTPAGDTVLDMGQNMVGRIRLTVEAAAGTRIVLKHAEVLDRDGNIYFGNLKEAKQEVEYICSGFGVEEYAPRFTFQGFRYVRVEGYPGQENGLLPENFVGEVMHTDMKRTGWFECSDPMVNRLQQNIVWGQRGNFVDVPTDCPQRNERLGWTADAQVFIGTALFNYLGGTVFTKWLRDLKAEQLPDGGVPFVIPQVGSGSSAAGWGDAAVIIPWTMYGYYGDKRLLVEQYGSMKAWVEYIRAQGGNEYAWNTGFQFGDWLALDAKENSYVGATPRELVATAYYAYSTRLLRDTAAILDKPKDAVEYNTLLEGIIRQFRGEFVTPFGRMASPTQTAHVLALVFDLVEGPVRERIARDLNELVVENGHHLSTGFVGTPYLCFALSDNGYHDTAVRLLQQENYPGWLYPITKGATTIWEHWDSIKPDGSFWSDNMNSFNHYAYGSIGDWLYRRVAGLDRDSSSPAYKKIRFHPQPGTRGLHYARAAFESMYGTVKTDWHTVDGKILAAIQVPVNATVEVRLPGATLDSLQINGGRLDAAAGILDYQQTDSGMLITAGSGSYEFAYTNRELFRVGYTENSLVRDITAYRDDREILERHLPEVARPPLKFYVMNFSLIQLVEQQGIAAERVRELLRELNRYVY